MRVRASNVDARVAASVGGLNAVLPQFQAITHGHDLFICKQAVPGRFSP